VRKDEHLHEGAVEYAAMSDIVSTTVIVIDSVRHVVIDDIAGLLNREQLLIVLLKTLLFLVIDIAGHDQAVVFASSIDGNNLFALVNLIDSFFKRGHAGFEIVAFCLEKCLLNFVQVDLAGRDFNFRLAGDIVLGLRARRATCHRQTCGDDAEGAKNAQATFHLDTPKLLQLHYNNAPAQKQLKAPTGGALVGLVLHNKLAIKKA